MKLNISIRTAPSLPPEPTRRMLYRVKPDQETHYWNFQVRPIVTDERPLPPGKLPDAPAVNRTGEIQDPSNFIRSPLGRKWQFFWADLLSMQKFARVYSELNTTEKDYIHNRLTSVGHSKRAFTNRDGLENRNNYVTGDIRGEDPKIDPLICAGSIVEAQEIRSNGVMQMARLNHFDPFQQPPTVTRDLLIQDNRILWATIIYPDGHLTPFPQLDGLPVPYPYIARHDVWYPVRDLTPL